MLKRTLFHLNTIIFALVVFVNCTNETPGEPERDLRDPEVAAMIAVNSADSVNFGLVVLGSSKSFTVVVQNTGKRDLEISSVELTGANTVDFKIDLAAPQVNIAPGETYKIVATFKPITGGMKNATLGITSNALNANTLKVVLIGVGIEPTPVAPSNLVARKDSLNRFSQINLFWTDNSDNEDGFEIERSLDALTDFMLVGSVTKNVTTFNDDGLSIGTQYFYRVRAFNTGGESSYSDTASEKTDMFVIVLKTMNK